MKARILNLEGEVKESIELPKCFEQEIRKDLIEKAFLVIDSKKRRAYGAYLLAGKEVSASGKFKHRRRAYKGAYGFGLSRVPRKILSRKGLRFSRVGAFVPGTRGGREAHPPKAEKIWGKKVNKKEKRKALVSAIAATASLEAVRKRYPWFKEKINFPIIVEEGITEVDKTKKIFAILKKIMGGADSLIRKKGLLLVADKKMKIKLPCDFAKIDELRITDLASGGKAGRIVIWTENAIKELSKPKN